MSQSSQGGCGGDDEGGVEEDLLWSSILNLNERDLQFGEVENGLYDGVHFDCWLMISVLKKKKVMCCAVVGIVKQGKAKIVVVGCEDWIAGLWGRVYIQFPMGTGALVTHVNLKLSLAKTSLLGCFVPSHWGDCPAAVPRKGWL